KKPAPGDAEHDDLLLRLDIDRSQRQGTRAIEDGDDVGKGRDRLASIDDHHELIADWDRKAASRPGSYQDAPRREALAFRQLGGRDATRRNHPPSSCLYQCLEHGLRATPNFREQYASYSSGVVQGANR